MEPIAATEHRPHLCETLLYDRGEKIDRAVRDMLAKTDSDSLADGVPGPAGRSRVRRRHRGVLEAPTAEGGRSNGTAKN